MLCPKCNSANITFNRECSNIYSYGSNKRIHKDTSIFIPSDFNRTTTSVSYHTTALCKNCGYSWIPEASGTGIILLKIWGFSLLLLLIGIGLMYFSIHSIIKKHSKSNTSTVTTEASVPESTTENGDPTVITTDREIDTAIWATEYTSIEDFEWDVDENGIVLNKYNVSGSKDAKIRLSDCYTINGVDYHIYKLDTTFTFKDVKSVIVPEGVTEIVKCTFNTCGIEYLYLPSTLEEYTGWNYFHDLKTLYYGGSEEDFNNKFDTKDQLKDVTIIYDANPDEL